MAHPGIIMAYFERLTPICWPADAHIQTPCDPLQAAAEFSYSNPGFSGLLEVSVEGLVGGRPVLTPVLVRVDGPGRCSLAPPNPRLPVASRQLV
ncbi:MAG: hypothetical protein LOD90_03205 [Symbiobacteriaceae bacterium]